MNEKKITMKELPVSERPFEKCLETGTEALSDKELLTILIRTGARPYRADEVALNVLSYCGEKGITALFSMTPGELSKIPGIRKVKGVQLAAACELSRRIASSKKPFGNRFVSSKAIADYYIPMLSKKTREQFYVIVLDTKNRVLHEELLSIGNISSAIADPRDIFQIVLKYNGSSIILLHNHPSGDPAPSSEDIKITKRIAKAGLIMGVDVEDHVIIGGNSYVSLREDGYFVPSQIT
ncbi:MAG: DNA repair protein RadC [Lachnospiraceae bacterium]|nr:DNA repair protein RadC [Lachnospiraceae bacterium]